MKKSKKRIITCCCVLIIIVLLCCCLKSCSQDSESTENVSKFVVTDHVENVPKKEDVEKEKDKSDSAIDQEKQENNIVGKDDATSKKDVPVSIEKVEESENNPDDSSKENKSGHVHNWTAVYKTIHYEEIGHYEKVLVKKAWNEEVPVYEKVFVMICNECDHVMRNAEELDAHFKGNFECGSWRDAYITENIGTEIIHHEAVYEEKYVVDKQAWDEQVVDHYSCSCGETKH